MNSNNILSTLTASTIATAALALSDGTPVTLEKVTSKGNYQVRLPADHALASDPLRIFRPDGTHYKNLLDVTLVATAPATDAATPAPTPAPVASNDNVTYIVDGASFDNIDDAKAEAIDIFSGDPSKSVEITATFTKVVGIVGFTALAA